MQLYPTRATFHVAVAGAGLIALAGAARLAPVVAFGGAMLLAVAIGRALALLSVTRLRAAGFEMLWTGPTRVYRMTRGGSLVLEGQLRNRGRDAVRGVGLRPVVSSFLEASVEPRELELMPGTTAALKVVVRARRVGRWGVHGLALEARGAPLGGEGLYEVPLIFANPLGIEVVPAALASTLDSAIGGRARMTSELGRPTNMGGEGDELRELRDHVPGDPFKRIAWRASARRGRLLVREMERQERAIVWLVVDSSVELWAGEPGSAPLDRVVDDVAATAARHLRRGDHVGLVVGASRLRAWIPPKAGAPHGVLLSAALASAASALDADRSELDEVQVARRVAEHARPLDPRGLGDVALGDLDGLAQRASWLRERAPFAPRVPFAHSPREQALRHYLAAFGIESPPRIDGERQKSEVTLTRTLERIAKEKPRPSLVHVWAPPPGRPEALAIGTAALRARRIEVRWSLPPVGAGIGSGPGPGGAIGEVVDEAVRARASAARARGERLLRRLGVRVVSRPIGRHPLPPRATP